MQQILVRYLGVGNLLEESFILVIRYFALISVPNGLQIVHNLSVELDWVTNELRELSNDLLYLSLNGELA
jgi:hypothetical protein